MVSVPKLLVTNGNMRSFCYTNTHLIKGPVRGILLSFHGRGDCGEITTDSDRAVELAEMGVVMIFPYYDPWAWMSRGTVKIADALVDVAFNAYGLDETVPIVCEGGSMGGLSALIYPLYAARTPVAAAANCPACDLVYHYGSRRDLPRYFVCAYGGETGEGLQEVLEYHSPMHNADRLPRIPFYVVHGLSDPMIAAGPNSERFCSKINSIGGNAVYVPVPGMGHCNMPEAVERDYWSFVYSFFNQKSLQTRRTK